MANWEHLCPDDMWGMSIEDVRRAIGRDARLTDTRYTFDILEGFKPSEVGQLMIVAKSRKKLRRAIDAIVRAKRAIDDPDPKPARIWTDEFLAERQKQRQKRFDKRRGARHDVT